MSFILFLINCSIFNSMFSLTLVSSYAAKIWEEDVIVNRVSDELRVEKFFFFLSFLFSDKS